MMTCADEILKTVQFIVKDRKNKEFTIREVQALMKKQGSTYSENSIRGRIASSCNADYSKHQHPYFRRVEGKRGVYVLL